MSALSHCRVALAALVAIVATALAVPTVATAASRPCHLVTDARGDVAPAATRGDAPGLDITSADVATTVDSVVVAIRVRGWQSLPQAGVGGLQTTLQLSFRTLGDDYVVEFQRGVDGDAFRAFGIRDGREGSGATRYVDATGALDERRAIVTIVAPRSLLFVPEARQTLSSIGARSFTLLDGGGSADVAGGAATYRDRARSCLVA